MTDHDLAQARQAIEGLLTDEVLRLIARAHGLSGSCSASPAVVVEYAWLPSVVADIIAPAWAEMQRERDEFETRLANLKFDLDMIGAQLGIAERSDIEGAVNSVVKRAEAAEAERDALRRVIESVRAELRDEPGDDDRLARVLALAKVDEALAAETGGSRADSL